MSGVGDERGRERVRLGPVVEVRELSAVRAPAQARPPDSFIQRVCSSSMTSVASAGVLSVCSRRELSMAAVSDRNGGMYRSEAPMRCARSIAAGLMSASHRPPSPAKFFCGAK